MESKEIKQFQTKKIFKSLEKAKGNGTSMITLIIPKGSQINQVTTMLTNEYGTASNIKSHVNKLSVQSAIRSAQDKLKQYNRIPSNGLIVCVGTVITDTNKEKKIMYDFEPFKPISHFLYRCDNKFHLKSLDYLFNDEESYGFIIMDGHGCLFAKVTGQNKEVLTEISVDLPNKHRRGGQSSARFGRLRLEKRHNYLAKVTEITNSLFITNDMPNVSGLIIGGSSDFKKQLAQDDRFDQRLRPIILNIVDIQYGSERGLYSALRLTSDLLKNTKFVKEQEILIDFFNELDRDTGLVCYGFNDVIYALASGAVDRLILFENMNTYYELKDGSNDSIPNTNSSNEQNHENTNRSNVYIQGKQIIQKTEGSDEELLVDYLIEIVGDYGATIEFVSDVTSEGSQFVKGFGIGAFLRYKIEIPQYDDLDDDDWDDDCFM